MFIFTFTKQAQIGGSPLIVTTEPDCKGEEVQGLQSTGLCVQCAQGAAQGGMLTTPLPQVMRSCRENLTFFLISEYSFSLKAISQDGGQVA